MSALSCFILLACLQLVTARNLGNAAIAVERSRDKPIEELEREPSSTFKREIPQINGSFHETELKKEHPKSRSPYNLQGDPKPQDPDKTSEESYLQAIAQVFGTQEKRERRTEDNNYIQARSPFLRIKPHKPKLHFPKTPHPLKLFALQHGIRRPIKKPHFHKHLLLSPGPEILGSSLNQGQDENEEKSEEMLTQILGAGKTESGEENPLHGAVLMKITTYNITRISDPKHGNGFLLTKNENVSAHVNYLDSREKFTNYSDAHSSSMQTVISEKDLQEEPEDIDAGELYTNDEDIDTKKENTKAIPRLSENQHANERNTKKVTNVPAVSPYQKENKMKPLDLPKNVLHHKDEHNIPTDFVGGTYSAVHHDMKSTPETVNGEEVATDGQRIILDDFVGGQYIKQDSQDKTEPLSKIPGEFRDEGKFDVISTLSESNEESQTQSDDMSTFSVTETISKTKNKIKTISQKLSPNGDFKNKSNKGISVKLGTQTDSSEPTSQEPYNNTRGPLFYNYDNIADDSLLGGTQTSIQEEEATKIPMTSETLEENSSITESESSQDVEEVLGITNENQRSILETDSNTGQYVTEIVGNHLPIHIRELKSTEPHLTDNTNEADEDPTSTESFHVSLNNFEAESTAIDPVILESKSSSPQSSSLGRSSSGNIVDDVELYAGTPSMSIIYKNAGALGAANPEGKDIHSKVEIVVVEANNENLTELCLPLVNSENMSLYDLITGDFFIEKDGKKIPLTLRENPLKNCTSGSKTCKLYLDLKSDSKVLQKEDLSENLEENRKSNLGKRQISEDELKIVHLNLHSRSHKLVDNDERNTEGATKVYSHYSDTSMNEMQPKSNKVHTSYNDVPLYENDQRELSASSNIYPEQRQTSLPFWNYGKGEVELSHSDQRLLVKPSDYFVSKTSDTDSEPRLQYYTKTNNKRPTRTVGRQRYVETDEEPKEDDCACSGSNSLLQSAFLATPSYKHFVGKRLSIMKNIVHAVTDWASDNA